MDDHRSKSQRNGQLRFGKAVGTQERRKLSARRGKTRSIWLGLGMLGVIGWSVAIPVLAGVGIGVWIDAHFPSRYSWALMLLVAGILLGCLNAWRWVANEERQIREEEEDKDQNERR